MGAILADALWRIIGTLIARIILFIPVVIFVWLSYVWLFVNHEWLGWIILKLQPITNALFIFIANNVPDAYRNAVAAGLTDELGPRALLLLILAAIGEFIVLTFWHILGGLFHLGRYAVHGRRHETV